IDTIVKDDAGLRHGLQIGLAQCDTVEGHAVQAHVTVAIDAVDTAEGTAGGYAGIEREGGEVDGRAGRGGCQSQCAGQCQRGPIAGKERTLHELTPEGLLKKTRGHRVELTSELMLGNPPPGKKEAMRI